MTSEVPLPKLSAHHLHHSSTDHWMTIVAVTTTSSIISFVLLAILIVALHLPPLFSQNAVTKATLADPNVLLFFVLVLALGCLAGGVAHFSGWSFAAIPSRILRRAIKILVYLTVMLSSVFLCFGALVLSIFLGPSPYVSGITRDYQIDVAQEGDFDRTWLKVFVTRLQDRGVYEQSIAPVVWDSVCDDLSFREDQTTMTFECLKPSPQLEVNSFVVVVDKQRGELILPGENALPLAQLQFKPLK